MLRFLTQRLSVWLRREDTRYELALVAFTLIVRICTGGMQSSPDPNQKWGFARQILAGGFPSGAEFNHHHARWGVNIPLLIVQTLFGQHAACTVIAPFAFVTVQNLLLYHLGKRLNGPFAGIAAAVLTSLLPSFGPMLSTTHTMAFEQTYLVLTFYALVRSADVRHNRWLALSCFTAFAAYMAKETTVFALPGLAYYAWISRQRLRDGIVFCASFLALFACETLLYRLTFGFKLGRLTIIKNHHLGQGKLQVPVTFWQLLERYTQLEPMMTILFYAALVTSLCIPFWFRYKRRERVPLILLGTLGAAWAFYFLTTFALKSINPMLPAQPPLPRYLLTGVPFLGLIVGWALVEWGEPLVRPFRSQLNARVVLTALPLLTALGVLLIRHPSWAETGIARTIKLERDVQNAFLSGHPLVVKERKPLRRNIERSVRFLYLTHEQAKHMQVIQGSPKVRAIVNRRRPEFARPPRELSKLVAQWEKVSTPLSAGERGFAVAKLGADANAKGSKAATLKKPDTKSKADKPARK